jgi:hypothetical protein
VQPFQLRDYLLDLVHALLKVGDLLSQAATS